jgi:hypothetical protein
LGHNYAKPLTAEARLARILQRLPEDWSVSIDRPAGGSWQVTVEKPNGELYTGSEQPTLVDALEEAWRQAR